MRVDGRTLRMRHTDLDDETNATTFKVVDAALAVHRELGPGLLEGIYADCLAEALRERGLEVEREKAVPLQWRGRPLGRTHKLDLVVASRVVAEVKAVQDLHPVHFAQLRTYLRLSNLPVGLLLNFHAPRMADGVHRLVATRMRG